MKLNEVIKLLEYREQAEDKLEEYYNEIPQYGEDMLFISYTAIDKIGINPQSTYNTPIGIYTYPLKEAVEAYGLHYDATKVPFAGDQPNIWVLKRKPDTKALDIKNYSNEQKKKDIKQLYRFITDWSKGGAKFGIGEDDLTKQEYFLRFLSEAQESAFLQTPAGHIWNITRALSNRIAVHNPSKPHIMWNYLLREVLGYDVFIDRGEAIVHESEPIQAGFLSKSAFKAIDLLKNRRASNEIQRLVKKIAGDLKGIKRDIDSTVSANNIIERMLDVFDKIEDILDDNPQYKEHLNQLIKLTKKTYLHALQNAKFRNLNDVNYDEEEPDHNEATPSEFVSLASDNDTIFNQNDINQLKIVAQKAEQQIDSPGE